MFCDNTFFSWKIAPCSGLARGGGAVLLLMQGEAVNKTVAL